MPETIFTKILAGSQPCHRVYEDALTFAFLDIAPLAPGHLLLIPKEPAETLDALSEASAAAIGRVLPRLCRAVMAATGTRAYNVLQNNGSSASQAVHHVHFHIIPKPSSEVGLHVNWQKLQMDAPRLAALAKQMHAAMAPG